MEQAIGSLMRRRFQSLQFRLILSFAVVLALSLGSVSVYAHYVAAKDAKQFQEQTEWVRATRVQRLANMAYSSSGGLSALLAVIEQAGTLYGLHITLVDSRGHVLADSFGQTTDQNVVQEWSFEVGPHGLTGTGYSSWKFADHTPKWGGPAGPAGDGTYAMPVSDRGAPVGTLLIQPSSSAAFVGPDPQASQIVTNLDHFLLWTGLAAAAAGIAVVYLTSRRMLAPVRALRGAAQRLGQGDLTQRVALAGSTEFAQLAHSFNAMAEGLQRAQSQRKDMMADIAHELRTPLANIQGYVEALRDGVMHPTTEAIETIYQQVMHLARLMEDLRLLALADAGALTLYREPVALGRMLQSSIEAFKPRAEAKGVSLSFDGPPDLPTAEIDSARIGQVVSNLVDNAITHTPEGGAVRVSARTVGEQARIVVADTGEGIPMEALSLVFERFYRVDRSRDRSTGGTGLGLSIAKHLVEAHGGSIHVESSHGRGTRFSVDLPLHSHERGRSLVGSGRDSRSSRTTKKLLDIPLAPEVADSLS